jgi:hypothetical protein
MVFADHVADDAGALLVGLVPVVRQLVHRVEHAAVHGLQTVADIGERAPHDHAHGVIEVGASHLLFEADGVCFFGELFHGFRGSRPSPQGKTNLLFLKQIFGDLKPEF